MDAVVRRLGYWLLAIGLLSFFADSLCYAAPQQVADASESEDQSADNEEDAGVEDVVGSLVTMATLRAYSYGALKGILILGCFWLVGVILFRVVCRVGRARHVDEG